MTDFPANFITIWLSLPPRQLSVLSFRSAFYSIQEKEQQLLTTIAEKCEFFTNEMYVGRHSDEESNNRVN